MFIAPPRGSLTRWLLYRVSALTPFAHLVWQCRKIIICQNYFHSNRLTNDRDLPTIFRSSAGCCVSTLSTWRPITYRLFPRQFCPEGKRSQWFYQLIGGIKITTINVFLHRLTLTKTLCCFHCIFLECKWQNEDGLRDLSVEELSIVRYYVSSIFQSRLNWLAGPSPLPI